MKYKVGNKVRIKSLDWYNENKDENGDVLCFENTHKFTSLMSSYCGKVVTISTIITGDGEYFIEEDGETNWYTEDMIEGLAEEEVFIKANDIYNEEYSKGEYCHEQSFKWGFQEGYNYSHENDKLEISLKEGYQFKDENGNVINAMKIVLEKKKPKYPTTYEECCAILGFHYDHYLTYGDEKNLPVSQDESDFIDSIDAFAKLIICRNAYWKIAGEEMGLGKPWKPDYNSGYIPAIIHRNGFIQKVEVQYRNAIFAFPTAEMRDYFYQYFNELIESVKELL